MRRFLALSILALTCSAPAQWQLQDSRSTASLRGIHSLGNGVAWASGTNGTVLRTTDDGTTWQTCPTPPAAEHLDFRGIQAFDTKTAIVMSSGKGDLSRLYKTTDACQTWKLVFTNPDKEGFWDTIRFSQGTTFLKNACFGQIVGDPVESHFALFLTVDCGDTWERQIRESPEAFPNESLFAASNSSLVVKGPTDRIFVTGGRGGPRLFRRQVGPGEDVTSYPDVPNALPGSRPFAFPGNWFIETIPSKETTQSSGAFSLAIKDTQFLKEVIVGGDYTKPDQTFGTAWYESGAGWKLAQTPPHGYRSAVAYSPTHKAWITVGPNGTDLSTDDGRTWRPLKPAAPNAAPEEDQHWNALSLPFVVGPKGRIGKLREDALPR